ncbi:tetratricopeptide repeat protein [Pirellulaceae bacterium SH449]
MSSIAFLPLCNSSVFGQRDDESQAIDLTRDKRSIATKFSDANRLFSAGKYNEARSLYQTIASVSSGTELGLQCEYFAAMSAWNLSANDETADGMASWLTKANAFETQVAQSGGAIKSPSWSHWIESATILLSRWDAIQGRVQEAKQRLTNRLADDSQSTTRFTRILAELGNLSSKRLNDYPSASSYLQQALESVGSDAELRSQILVSLATNDLQLNRSTYLADCIADLAQMNHSGVSATSMLELANGLAITGSRQESIHVLQSLVRTHPNASESTEARIRLSYAAAIDSDWQGVLQLTEQAIDSGQVDSWTTYALYLNAKAKIETNQAAEGSELLDSLLQDSSLSEDLQANIRLDLAQHYYRTEAWGKLEPVVAWLAELDRRSAPAPSWRQRVWLWQAELLAHKNFWEEAERIVSAIRNDFPEWNRRSEVDYLLARCQVARAEFDSARSILTTITEPVSLAARAAWMVGETYMMQRRYEEASQAYNVVLRFPSERLWCAASIVQMGLCAEQRNRFQEADEHYEKVITEYPESPFARDALARKSDLNLSTKQVERIGSGTKR